MNAGWASAWAGKACTTSACKSCTTSLYLVLFGPGPVASDAGRSKEGLGLVLDLADQDDLPVLGSLGSPAVRSAAFISKPVSRYL